MIYQCNHMYRILSSFKMIWSLYNCVLSSSGIMVPWAKYSILKKGKLPNGGETLISVGSHKLYVRKRTKSRLLNGEFINAPNSRETEV